MSNKSDPDLKDDAGRLLERLRSFACSLGLDEVKTQQIVKQVVIDMPLHTEQEQLEWAWNWMLAASPLETISRD